MAHLPPVMARQLSHQAAKPAKKPLRTYAEGGQVEPVLGGMPKFWLHYMPVKARCTNANTAIIKNKMIVEMLHPRPAYLATPSIPPVPAKNKTT
jgi:hypothetical protein